MAFQTGKQQNSFNSSSKGSTPTPTEEKKSDTVNISGLYEGNAGSALVLKGKTSSEIVIPAGYQVKVFRKGGKSQNGKDLPPFELVAQPPRAPVAKK